MKHTTRKNNMFIWVEKKEQDCCQHQANQQSCVVNFFHGLNIQPFKSFKSYSGNYTKNNQEKPNDDSGNSNPE